MDGEYCIGDMIEVTGQFRSYNSYENGDNRLVLTVFAKDICHFDEEESKNPNTLFLNGFICKEPVYRTTPFGREITDILLAVNQKLQQIRLHTDYCMGSKRSLCKKSSRRR